MMCSRNRMTGLLARSVLGVLACAGIATVTAGCKKKGADAAQTSESAQQARSLYAKGFNALLDDPRSMLKEFFEKVPETGVPAKGNKVNLFARHTFAKSDIKEASEAFEQAKAAGEDIAHVAPLADKTLAAIKQVHETFRQAHNYYEAEDYKDDGGAKGKKFVADMKKAATTFQEGLDALSGALSELEDKETLAELERFSASKGPSYLFRNFNFRAKKLLDARGDKAAFESQYSDLAKAHAEMETWRQGNKPSSAFSSYAGLADGFFNTAKKLKRSVGDNTAADEVQRTSRALVSDYNTLVTMGNSLYQVEAAGAL